MDVASLAIRTAEAEDFGAILDLHQRAFARDEVPRLVEALIKSPAAIAPISLVAVGGGGKVVGHVLLSAARLDAPPRLVDVATLSPLAVAEEVRRHGIGTRLIGSALAEADKLRIPLVFLEGSPRYYSTRGFEPAGPLGFRRPSLRIPEAAFQVARLSAYEPWMTGSFVYSEAFWAHDCVGLR